MPAALPYPPPPIYYPPPRRDHLALIIVIVILLLVLVPTIIAAILYAVVSGQLGGPGPLPTPIAALVSKASNGSYWIVTFASVPGGMTPADTDLLMTTSASYAAVPATPLSALPGGNVTLQNSLGSLYIAYHGARAGTVSVGDTLLIATSTSIGGSTTGYSLQITWNGLFFNTSLA